MIFGIQMYHEEMQVMFEHGCSLIIIGGVIALGLRKHTFMTVSVHFLIDGLMDSNDIWFTDVS
jgi:hypothetical protein